MMQWRAGLGVLCAGALAACGGGGFAGPPVPRTDYHAFVVADVNGDGLLDVVAARVHFAVAAPSEGAVDEFLRDPMQPAVLLPPVSFAVGCTPYGIAVADLNGDALPDVLVSCTADEKGFRVLLQKPTGGGELLAATTIAMPAPVFQITTVDVDLDGLPDVVAALDTKLAFVTQKTGTPGTFNAPVEVGAGSERVLATDLDGDGLVDLVAPRDVANNSTAVSYYLQDTAVPGTFAAEVVLESDCASTDVASGRLDSNASLDIGVANVCDLLAPDGAWTPFLQRAAKPGTFARGARHDSRDSFASLIAIADLDDDGRDDVALLRLTAVEEAREFDVYLQTAPGEFVRGGRYRIPRDRAVTEPGAYAIVLADFDGDGLLDVGVSTNEIFYFPQLAAARGTFGAAVRIASQH